MSNDTKRPDDQKPGEKLPGTFHYNPVNMSGKKAGVFEEQGTDEAHGNVDQDEQAEESHDDRENTGKV